MCVRMRPLLPGTEQNQAVVWQLDQTNGTIRTQDLTKELQSLEKLKGMVQQSSTKKRSSAMSLEHISNKPLSKGKKPASTLKLSRRASHLE